MMNTGRSQPLAVRPKTTAQSLLARGNLEFPKDHEPESDGEQLIVPISGKDNIPHGFDGNTDADSSANMDDPKLVRLLSLYHAAQIERDEVQPQTSEFYTCSRFIRDTAENCIQYMSSINPGDVRLEELRNTFEETARAVEKGLNGQKRRFDYDWKDTPRGPVKPTPPSRREKKRLRGRTPVKYSQAPHAGCSTKR